MKSPNSGMALLPRYPLFAYGTLLNAHCQRTVLGRQCHSQAAVLADYALYQGKWPYIVLQPGAFVVGRLLLGLRGRDWERLDAYEDATPQAVAGGPPALYKRERVRVTVSPGRSVTAWVYLPLLAAWESSWLAKSPA